MGVDRNRQPAANALARFGEWLSVERNFLLYSTLGVGGAMSILMFLVLRSEPDFDGVVFWLFVSPLIFLGGYVWGLIMWRFFETRRKQWGCVGNDDA